MSATILDGNKISAEIKSEVAAEVAELKSRRTDPRPCCRIGRP